MIYVDYKTLKYVYVYFQIVERFGNELLNIDKSDVARRSEQGLISTIWSCFILLHDDNIVKCRLD